MIFKTGWRLWPPTRVIHMNLRQKVHSNEVAVSKYETIWIRRFFTNNYSFYEILGKSHCQTANGSCIAWKATSRPWISGSPTSLLDLVPFLSFEAVAVGKCREWSSFLSICKKSSAKGNGGWYWCLGHGWVNEASSKTESIDSIRR